jgi:hypothetical protein
VSKISSSGTVIWARQIPQVNTTSNDDTPVIVCDKLNNVYVAYSSTGTVSGGTKLGSSSIVVFKLNSDGIFQWVMQNPLVNGQYGNTYPSITCDTNNNIYVAYENGWDTISGGTHRGGNDIVVFKVNSNGEYQWAKQNPVFNTSGSDSRPKITCDKNNNIYVTYYTGTLNKLVSGGTITGNTDIIVFKLDEDGNHIWNRQNSVFNTTGTNSTPSIASDNYNNIYITYENLGFSVISGGTTANPANPPVILSDIVVFKLDEDGNHIWNAQMPHFNSNGRETNPTISIDNNSNILIAYEINYVGTTNSVVSGGTAIPASQVGIGPWGGNSGYGDVVIFKLSQMYNTGLENINNYVNMGTYYSTYIQNNVSKISNRGVFKGFLKQMKRNFIENINGVALNASVNGLSTSGLYIERSLNLNLNKNIYLVNFESNDILQITSTIISNFNKGYGIYFFANNNDVLNINIDSTNYEIQFTTSGIIYNSNEYFLDDLVTFGTLNLYIRALGSILLQSDSLEEEPINDAICFLPDTLIKTKDGYKPIQNISSSDYIINYYNQEIKVKFTVKGQIHEIKNKRNECPYLIKKKSLGNDVPNIDTYISPEHKIFINKKPILTKSLRYRDGIKQSENIKLPIIYYNVAIEECDNKNYDKILYNTMYANNMLVETLSITNKKIVNYKKIY